MKSYVLATTHNFPYRKKDQCQPKVIISTILVVLELYQLLQTKFQGHRSSGFRTEAFLRFFEIYGLGGHLGQVTNLIYINFHFHSPISFSMNFSFKLPNSFWEKSFNSEI